jgi:hypothetical protein
MTTSQELPRYTHEIRPLTFDQLTALMGDLRPARVSSRKGAGSGPALSYLEAWDVKATLIKVFGFGGFSSDIVDSKIERVMTKAEAGGNAAWVVMCSATIRLYIHQLGATYTETAVSSQSGSQIGEVADFAMKTAESDALKRCAINLGTQFGLSLYNKGNTGDVVKNIFEPHQRGMLWPGHVKLDNPAAQAQPQTPEQEVAALQSIVHGQAGDRFANRPLPEGMTQEQRDANVALLNQAMSARAKVDAANGGPRPLEQEGVDYNTALAVQEGPAAVLEPDYSAEAEAYAAADGQHE